MRKSNLYLNRMLLKAKDGLNLLSMEDNDGKILEYVKNELGYKKHIISKEDFINDINNAINISIEKFKRFSIEKGDSRIMIIGEDLIGSSINTDYEKIYKLNKTLNKVTLVDSKDYDELIKEKLSALREDIKKHFGKEYDDRYDNYNSEFPSFGTFYKDKDKAIKFLESTVIKTMADILKAKYVYRAVNNSDSYYYFMLNTDKVYSIIVDQTHDGERFDVFKPKYSVTESLVEYNLLHFYSLKDPKHKIEY